jgi:hypothetical protein
MQSFVSNAKVVNLFVFHYFTNLYMFFSSAFSGLQSVTELVSHTDLVTSTFPTTVITLPTVSTQRRVPLMGSLVLKRSSSETSSSSGFGSGSSQNSDIPSCGSETENIVCDHSVFLSTLV